MAPVTDAHDAPVSSAIGSASSSARTAIAGPSAGPIRMSRPVLATSGAPGASSAVATIARETHVSDLAQGQSSKLQINFSYSDGFGREIQRRILAESGSPGWVASGWTIFNNKGKPVRKYEPFFDDTNDFKFGLAVGAHREDHDLITPLRLLFGSQVVQLLHRGLTRPATDAPEFDEHNFGTVIAQP